MKDAHWFVSFRETGEGMEIGFSGPFSRAEIPSVLHILLDEQGFDGIWEWDGRPNRSQIVESVKRGAGIGSAPGAVRLILSEKSASKSDHPIDIESAEFIRDTVGLNREPEN